MLFFAPCRSQQRTSAILSELHYADNSIRESFNFVHYDPCPILANVSNLQGTTAYLYSVQSANNSFSKQELKSTELWTEWLTL